MNDGDVCVSSSALTIYAPDLTIGFSHGCLSPEREFEVRLENSMDGKCAVESDPC